MMEATREIKLRNKVHRQSVRVREKNRAEKRLLQRRFHQLSAGSQRSEALIDREIRRIKDNIWRQEGVEEFQAASVETTRVPSALSKSQRFDDKKRRAQSAPVSRSYNDYAKLPTARQCMSSTVRPLTFSCQLQGNRQSCSHFPCNKDIRYTKIGFDITSNGNKFNQCQTAEQMLAKSREGFIMDLEAQSIRRPLQTSRDQTSHKISALRTLIVEMKQRSEANKPQDWTINYGKPTSKRKLLRVARPSSAQAFLGI